MIWWGWASWGETFKRFLPHTGRFSLGLVLLELQVAAWLRRPMVDFRQGNHEASQNHC